MANGELRMKNGQSVEPRASARAAVPTSSGITRVVSDPRRVSDPIAR